MKCSDDNKHCVHYRLLKEAHHRIRNLRTDRDRRINALEANLKKTEGVAEKAIYDSKHLGHKLVCENAALSALLRKHAPEAFQEYGEKLQEILQSHPLPLT